MADAPQLDEICTCGRKCKGRRGLKAHQRSCGVFKGLIEGAQLATVSPSHVSTTPPDEDHIINQQGAHATLPSPIPMPTALTAKPGLKLPKTKERWSEANVYFHSIFATRLSQPVIDLDEEVEVAQDEVYNYFGSTYGFIQADDQNGFKTRYDDQSVKSLKRSLRLLKQSTTGNDCSELRYVSALIRKKLSTITSNLTDPLSLNVNLDKELKTKFWPTCRKVFDCALKCAPTFNINNCYTYFLSTLSQSNNLQSFNIPEWMPRLPVPTHSNCIPPPTYKQVASAINRCRPGSSACPLDQLSILILKNCPILRTLLHRYIRECWLLRRIPGCWKRGHLI